MKTTVSFDIPTKHRGLVVGPKGCSVKAMRKQHKVGITIEDKQPRGDLHLDRFHVSDRLRILEQDPFATSRFQYQPTVKVTIEGTESACDAAKASILGTIENVVEQSVYIPCRDIFDKIQQMSESSGDVSLTPRYYQGKGFRDVQSPRTTIRGPRAFVDEVIELLDSIGGLTTIAIPTAIRKDIASLSSRYVELISLESFNDEMEELFEVVGDVSHFSLVQQKIAEKMSCYSRERLWLSELHSGDIAHVRTVLSLTNIKSRFDCLKYLTEDALNETQFVNVYCQNSEDLHKKATELKELIKSVGPNDLLVLRDKALLHKLSVPDIGSYFSRNSKVDESIQLEVKADCLVLYRAVGGEVLHSHSGEIDSVLMSGLDKLKQFAEANSKVVLDVPSMKQPLLQVPYLKDAIDVRLVFYQAGIKDDKDKLTLFGEHEAVEKAAGLIWEILRCEEEPKLTQTIEVPSLFTFTPGCMSWTSGSYTYDYDIDVKVVGTDGLPLPRMWDASYSDKSLVTFTGNRIFVEASNRAVEEDLSKFTKLMFSVSAEIDREFLMRVVGRNFRHVKRLERLHKVEIALPEETPTYPFLFSLPNHENTLDQINICGASEKSVMDAKNELVRLLDRTRNSTKTISIRDSKSRYIFEGFGVCDRSYVCLGVDFEFDDEADSLHISGCSPDLDDAVKWVKYMLGHDLEESFGG